MTSSTNNLSIIGHRGAAGLEFENTLASIQKAIDLGVNVVEIDVWKTTDNQIVVFHDASLERLTSESGFISEMDFETLRTIKLKNGDQIPTLKEVIALVKAHKVTLLVEVKAENAFAETLAILEQELSYSDFLIGSFYHTPIMELKKATPSLRTAIMFECVPAKLDEYLAEVNPEYVVVSIYTSNQYLTDTVNSQNRKLFFYTVNNEAEIAMAVKARPYGIITNFPDCFLKGRN